jgi:hypothetical protein
MPSVDAPKVATTQPGGRGAAYRLRRKCKIVAPLDSVGGIRFPEAS